MKFKVLKGARVLMSTDGNNTLYIDTGNEIVPVTSPAVEPVAGLDGEDGGYYTPAVTAAGVLSWSASKTGMPAVASANIRGPQGLQGPAGPAGATGPKGEQGEVGPQGPAGANGTNGTNGTNGRGVVSIALTVDANGAVTGGTVTYTDSTTDAITVSQAVV